MADNKTGAKTEAKTELSLAEVQKQIAEMLEAAKAEAAKISEDAKTEAAKIVEDAKAATGKPTKGMTKEELAAHKAEMEELVDIKLFKDSGKYKDDVFVSVNGETVAIKRGERVKIKRKFAEVLDNSEHQDYETSVLIEQKQREYAKAQAALE